MVKNIKLLLYVIILITVNSQLIKNLINKYEAIVENINIEDDGKMISRKEISTNKQILIIPTANVMSSEEQYQFKDYFSKNAKEKLVGRLLIERFIGQESFYYYFIESLPKDLEDYYHFNEKNMEEFNKRSLIKYNLPDRKVDYEALMRKIPTNEIPTLLLNWELYNWAHSIIDFYGITMKKKYYSEVKRLSRDNNNEDIVLIPCLNLFKNGPFKINPSNNLSTSLFAYKEHIYLNSDRYFDENEEIFNEIQFIPNIKLFQLSGKIVKSHYHEEMTLTFSNKDWTLKKINLCKDLECLPKGNTSPQFNLKYEISNSLINYCQIDQLQDSDDPIIAFRNIRLEKKISAENYSRALLKCTKIIKNFMNNSGKTTIIKDFNDLYKKNYSDNKDLNILEFAISQKKILHYHIKLFNNRLIREYNKELFSTLKNKYI